MNAESLSNEIKMKREVIEKMIEPTIYMNEADFKMMQAEFEKNVRIPEQIDLRTFDGLPIEISSLVEEGNILVADKYAGGNSILDRFWSNLIFGTNKPLSDFQTKGEGLAAQQEIKELPKLTLETFKDAADRYTKALIKQRRMQSIRIGAPPYGSYQPMIEEMHHRITPTRPLKYKLPFQQQVVDANNDVYEYFFVDGKVHYSFDCTVFFEKEKTCGDCYYFGLSTVKPKDSNEGHCYHPKMPAMLVPCKTTSSICKDYFKEK